MSYEVIRQEHDEAGGVYRLVVGIPVMGQATVHDDDGNPVTETVHDIGPDGEPLMWTPPVEHGDDEFEDPQPVMVERLVTETRTVGYTNALEFVFADDDDRWHEEVGGVRTRRPDETVAAEQREQIAEHLAQRADDDAFMAERVRELPGAGQAL